MNTAEKSTLLTIAKQVRKWAEHQANDSQYASGLCGWCAIASAELSNRLSLKNIKHEIAMAQDIDICCHVFLLCQDHVIDVTATQFAEFKDTPVVLMHHKEVDHHWFYVPQYYFKSSKQLMSHQLRTGWPTEQIAIQDNLSSRIVKMILKK